MCLWVRESAVEVEVWENFNRLYLVGDNGSSQRDTLIQALLSSLFCLDDEIFSEKKKFVDVMFFSPQAS